MKIFHQLTTYLLHIFLVTQIKMITAKQVDLQAKLTEFGLWTGDHFNSFTSFPN